MKFFKSVTAIALSLTMVMGLAACGGSAEPEQNAPDEQQGEAPSGDVKTYKIATDTTFAPFEFEDESGNFVGIDIDILNAIAQDQGFEVDLQVLGFSAALQAEEA